MTDISLPRRAFLKDLAALTTLHVLPHPHVRAWSNAPTAPLPDQETILGNAVVRVIVTIRGGQVHERYDAKHNGVWSAVATSADAQGLGAVAVLSAPEAPLSGMVYAVTRQDGALVQEYRVGSHRVVRTLTVLGDTPWIHVATRFEASTPVSLWQLADHFHATFRSDWSFSPSVGGVVPDGQYKAPLVQVQSGRLAFALVPDLLALNADVLARSNHALTLDTHSLDAPSLPALSVGFQRTQLVSHCVYGPAQTTWTAAGAAENAYYMYVSASSVPGEGYRDIVRFHWRQFGRPAQRYAAQQQRGSTPAYAALTIWDTWRETVWGKETPTQWLTVPLSNGITGGGVATQRWGPGPSIYYSAWFNTMRTSYGMALYARRTGRAELLAMAAQTVALAVHAPGFDGAFKCIAVPTDKGVVWGVGDGTGNGVKEGFLGYDMCWTAYWLLQWRAAKLPGSDAMNDMILDRCRRLASFMIARQCPDGMLPTQFTDAGLVNEELSRTVKAETGPVALFLLALYAQDRNRAYLDATRRALAFLEANVIPRRQWYDFETFWSCSPRQPRLDEPTQQWPANNLALGQTVAAYLLAAQVTGDARYLATGEALLDYLLLFQQCWTNPIIEELPGPATLLGGFTTQNSDAEWSDARQSQCGNVLLGYYRETGKVEYLERGVAALRAQFPVSPSENWAHTGYGGRAGVSSFHWGTGSGMAGIEIEYDDLRDAVVDVAAGRGVGINGLDLTACEVGDDVIRFELRTPFAWQTPPTIVFRHVVPERRYAVEVNGVRIGSWTGTALARGIPVTPARV